jgi:hypothetical protein
MKIYVLLYLAEFFLEWEIFHTKFVEEVKLHFVFNNFFSPENHAVYETVWEKW